MCLLFPLWCKLVNMAATRKKMDTRNLRAFVCALSFVFTILHHMDVAEAQCKFGEFDLTRLQSFNPWTVRDNKTNVVYDIHVCDTPNPSASCANGIAVSGRNLTTNTETSYGNCSLHFNVTHSDQSELLVMVKGSPCPSMPEELITSIIYFKCGKKLGLPVYLGRFVCSAYFEWESFEFCTELEHPANEIPCYVYNNSQLIDLSPLTKLKGGYLVDSENNRDFYINVCRDITPDSTTGTGACPKNSSSCRLISGAGASMGRPTTKLVVQDDEIKMTYKSTQKPSGCIDNPVTNVFFRCPERGGGKEPMLINDFMCNIDILWFTEYACPQATLTSNTCQLTKESHNIDVDLSPLTKPSGSYYTVNGTEGQDSYSYFINVCGQLGIPCGKGHTVSGAVCQIKQNGDDGKVLGKADEMNLRYSDGDLTLTYTNGEKCHTHFHRTTIINFECQQDAGVGEPVFGGNTNCTYMFNWKTSHACVNHPGDTACHVEHGGKLFDLSDLTIEQGNNWLGLSDQSGDDAYQYYINVCHDVLQTNGAESCPSGSAICRKAHDGKSVSLGSYTKGLQYNAVTQKIFINYTSVSSSDHACPGTINTVITFICKPGDLESAPSLVHKSEDQCVYQFNWYTAAACPMSHQFGRDCTVVDTKAGYSFDLTSLTLESGDPYKVSVGDYDYYINVCAKIGGNHCKDKNAAVCQVKKDGSAEIKTGEPSQNLEYFNGVLNLTYTNGEQYHDPQKTPRETEIAFVCDPEAGKGSPKYLTERNHTYSFMWLTAFACPTQPIECVVEDSNGKQYDLSSLSKSASGENWVVLDDFDPSRRRKFYINVCRSLAPIPGLVSTGCDLNAAACVTSLDQEKESVVVNNLGQAKKGPVIQTSARENYLRLEYTDGAACPDGGDGAHYNTTIHFLCVEGQQSRGPSPPRKVGPCSYEVIWDTSAACALKETDTNEGKGESTADPCTITDANYTYSLQTLTKQAGSYYTVQTPDKSQTFRLNICGAVASPDCDNIGDKSASVCEVLTSGGKPGLAKADSVDMRLTEENNIMVTYAGERKASGHQTLVQIELTCNREADETASITYVSHKGDSYLFRLETPISCAPQPVDCVVQDKDGKQYDLTPLAKVTGNYDVQDSRPDHRDLHYLINVCRPVNPIAGSFCPGGPIGGCQTGGRGSYSLGYIQGKPHVASDGTITLRYIGGSVCHRGKPEQARRSMRINFYCARDEGVPQFVGESANCEYSFTWKTPAACPQQRSIGSDCKVSDPLYSYQFDLTMLRKSDSNYNVPTDKYNFLLNVCGPLHSPPTGCGNMAACQTGGSLNTAMATGQANSTLIYDAGELSLVYDQGKASCHGKYTRKTIITFVCDHSQKGAGDGPRYLKELEDCTYTFVWPTALACPPHTVVDCTYTDPSSGNHYDLSHLARPDANYVKTDNDITYIINICRTLVHRKGETCPFGAAACKINATEHDLHKKYQSLGKLTSNAHAISMEEGQLVIKYLNGDTCSAGGKMSTLITLSCDATPGAVETGPMRPFQTGQCQNTFVWTTPSACPVVPGANSNIGRDCKVKNPRTNYEFDLSKLKKTNGAFSANDRDGHHFYLNVCAPVSGTSCSNSATGSCQSEINNEESSVNAGIANAHLTYHDNGILTLNYSSGDICSHNVSRSTLINFICHKNAGDGVPTYVASSDNCVYYFDWHTELVCEEEVLCEVSSDGKTFDLTPLIKDTGYHLAIPGIARTDSTTNSQDSSGIFYINVCRPLNPIFNTLCPAGSAACREVAGKPPQSLGQARSPPRYDSTVNGIVLEYDHGNPCFSDPSQNASSRIIFRCKRGPDQGVPKLIEVSRSCEYVFEWGTNAICADDAVEKETSNCTFYDQRTEYLFNLSPLKDPAEVPSPQGGKMYIQACGTQTTHHAQFCKGAAVCLVGSRGLGSVSLQDGSYGSASSGKFRMDGESLKLTFTEGQKCQHGDTLASTTIIFECDYEAGNGQPEPMPHFQCQLNFRWRTSLVCPPLVEDCTVSSGGTAFDLSVLSQSKESWEFISNDGSRHWINLCQGVHGEAYKENCPPLSAVCRKTKDGQVDMLGDVRSQNISVEGDGTIVIQYSQGSSACSYGRRRSNNPLAKTVIRLSCGPTVGVPRLSPRKVDKENCLFEFTWKSRAVCKNESLPQKLKDINQVIQDPRSGGSIDLRPLLQGGNHQAFDGKYSYAFSLEGHLILDHNNAATSACNTAAICQQLKDNTTYHRNLGSYASRKYYLNEGQLEVEYTSPEKCVGKYSSKSVTSIITFSCSSDSSMANPVFLYKTLDCTYLFTWDTSAACIQATAEVATARANSNEMGAAASDGKSGGLSSSTLTVALSIFFGLLIVFLLAIYLRKPDRRAAAANRMKNVILCRRTTENEMRYSVLAQMEEDPEVSPVGTNPFEEDMENELQNGDTMGGRTYHDDSDDDMLL